MPDAPKIPNAPAPAPILRVEGLAVSFPAANDQTRGPRRSAVEDVALELHPGRTTAVVGESGSGKSVTALSILRLLRSPPARYEAGRILYTRRRGDRVDLLDIPEKTVREIRGDEIAMIFQEPMTSLNPVMRIGEQIIESIRLHRNVSKKQARELAINALTEVGIHDAQNRFGAYPHEFSGGMRQRVMIAIALACEPRVLIADEPTTALDVTIQAQILALLDSLKAQRGLAIMLISHDLGLVSNHADNVVVMYAGHVVETGPVATILREPIHPYTRGLLASAPRLGDHRKRLRTLSTFLTDPSVFKITHDGQTFEAWWPEHGQGEKSTGVGHLRRVGSSHAVRVRDELSTNLSRSDRDAGVDV